MFIHLLWFALFQNYFSGRQCRLFFIYLSVFFLDVSYRKRMRTKKKLIEQSIHRSRVRLSIKRKKKGNEIIIKNIHWFFESCLLPIRFLFLIYISDLYLNWSDFSIITWWQQCKSFDEGNQETLVWMFCNWLFKGEGEKTYQIHRSY